MPEQITILLVDDDPMTRKIVPAHLKQMDVKFLIAEDGESGLAMALYDQPDLILLDVRMPSLDGFEVCEILKQNPTTSHIPIIFLTSATDPSEKIRAYELGASDYVTKPFNGRELSARVAASLRMQDLVRRLAVQANTDELTGLSNRTAIADHLSRLILREQQENDYTFAVLFLDFDRFKIINDSLGHAAGDELLIAITRSMSQMLDEHYGHHHYKAARLGGDEFLVVLSNPTNEQAVDELAHELQRKLTGPYMLGEHEIIASASMGIVISEGRYTDPQEIIRDADTAMYHAKADGKARHSFFNQEMHVAALDLLMLENDLRSALERNEFELLYQPIHNMETGRLKGFEALIRWHHPFRGTVPPLQFIHVAEETGLIVPIGWWILHQAAGQLQRWHEDFPQWSELTMNINISKRQLIHPDFVSRVKKGLDQTKVKRQCLTLEITESTIMGNLSTLKPVLQGLRDLGPTLAMDDFGTGHSSLGCLHKFPIDSLKVDRSFICNVEKDPSFASVLFAIVTLAHNLDLTVVAEGLETAEQVAHLQGLECDYGQGYYFAKPMSAKDAEALLCKDCDLAQSA